MRRLMILAVAIAGFLAACHPAERPTSVGGYAVPADDVLLAWIRGWVIEDLALQAASREDRTIEPEQMSDFRVSDITYDTGQQMFSVHVSFEMMKPSRHMRVEGEIRFRPAGTVSSETMFVDFVSKKVTEIASW
jgi:hypothetical protein